MLDSDIRRWAVCERSNRWLQAVRRFAPAMTPDPLILDVVEADPARISDVLISGLPSIVLWEVGSESLLQASQWLRKTSAAHPLALQLVANDGLSHRERTLLCEFPLAILIEQPEELPRIHPMVEGHFASSRHSVD